MRYYSEETVKKIMEKVDVSYHSYSQYDTSLQEEVRKYPNLNKFKSIDIAEPHGRLIDAEELVKKYKDECWEELMLFVSNAPTILEASKA